MLSKNLLARQGQGQGQRQQHDGPRHNNGGFRGGRGGHRGGGVGGPLCTIVNILFAYCYLL